MFTRSDYANYFEQVAHVERRMIYRSYELGMALSDEPLRRIFQNIGDDKVRHYGYVLKMLSVVADSGRAENRLEVREQHFALVRVKFVQGEESMAYSVNLSKRGICLESERLLSPESVCDLEILSLGAKEAMLRRGQVVWSKKIKEGFFISGMKLHA